MDELTFTYKRRPVLMFFMILLGAVCTVTFVYMALYDPELELRFLGFYAAGWEARALAWFFGAFMAGLSCLGVWGLVRSAGKPRAVTLGPTALIAPKAPISKKMITVPYGDITKVRKEDVINQVMLHVTFEGGKVSISKSWLADKTAFDTIQKELRARWDAATGVNVS